jgi:hypothetical protein
MKTDSTDRNRCFVGPTAFDNGLDAAFPTSTPRARGSLFPCPSFRVRYTASRYACQGTEKGVCSSNHDLAKNLIRIDFARG